jgi:hypothetical protein
MLWLPAWCLQSKVDGGKLRPDVIGEGEDDGSQEKEFVQAREEVTIAHRASQKKKDICNHQYYRS